MKVWVSSTEMLLLLITVFVYTADCKRNDGCESCSLRRHPKFPVYQCMGCCFSRAYPTPLGTLRSMVQPKIFTSEASCCVATDFHMVEVSVYDLQLTMRNHSECHCGTCIYHKQ